MSFVKQLTGKETKNDLIRLLLLSILNRNTLDKRLLQDVRLLIFDMRVLYEIYECYTGTTNRNNFFSNEFNFFNSFQLSTRTNKLYKCVKKSCEINSKENPLVLTDLSGYPDGGKTLDLSVLEKILKHLKIEPRIISGRRCRPDPLQNICNIL